MHEELRSAHVEALFYEALPYQQEHWIRLIRRVGSETGDNLAHELHESVSKSVSKRTGFLYAIK